MNNKEKKIRKHRILGIPVLGAIIGSIFAYVLCEIVIGGGIGLPLDVHFNGLTLEEAKALKGNMLFYFYLSAFAGILMAWLHKKWFQGEFKGAFSGSFGDKRTKAIIFIACIAIFITVVASYAAVGVKAPTLAGLGTALMAGIVEEVCFRLILISLMLRKSSDKKHILLAVIVSSLIFGSIHMQNATIGQSMAGTVIQVINAFGMGVFFAAMYLKTGNLLINIVIHVVYDFLALMQGSASGIIVDTGSLISVDSLQAVTAAIFYIVCGFLLLKGSAPDIDKLWKNLWSRED